MQSSHCWIALDCSCSYGGHYGPAFAAYGKLQTPITSLTGTNQALIYKGTFYLKTKPLQPKLSAVFCLTYKCSASETGSLIHSTSTLDTLPMPPPMAITLLYPALIFPVQTLLGSHPMVVKIKYAYLACHFSSLGILELCLDNCMQQRGQQFCVLRSAELLQYQNSWSSCRKLWCLFFLPITVSTQ